MASFHRELPSEGLIKLDVELGRGNLTVRSARPGEVGALESDWDLDATTDGKTLRVRQPLDIKRPNGLADLIGEQQVRIAIEGVVLFDKQIRHGGGDVRIVLPASVRELRCRTARGDIHLEGVEAVAEAYTGRGNVLLSGGRAPAAAGTGSGDVKVSGWLGPLHIRTGKGNLEVRDADGHLDAKTGKGEIRIEGARARVDAHTGHGNIVADRLSGRASLSTGHGDLVATDLEGGLEASTGHGGITLGGRLAGAKVKTGHGDIVCRLAAAEGSHELHTGRGSIILDLHGGVAARVDASTRHGGIYSNLPLVKVGTSGPAGVFSQRLVGTTAGSNPSASIHLNTKGGDIRVFRREERTSHSAPTLDWKPDEMNGESRDKAESATATSPPMPKATAIHPNDNAPANGEPARTADPQADQARSLELEILGAVSRGELTVDEAMVLLERAKKDNGGTRGEINA